MPPRTPRTVLLLSVALVAAACSANGGGPTPDGRTPGEPRGDGPPPADGPRADGPRPDGPRADGPRLVPDGPPPGPILPPDPPPASQVIFTIHSQQKVRPISRFIYGLNSASFGSRPKNLTLTRAGGNRWTAYNWENNASNAGTDWLNQNDGFLGGGATPGEAVRAGVAEAHAASASALVTVPIAGYVAADKNGGGDVNQTPSYLQTRFRVSKPKKGSAFTLSPDPNDGFVYQDEYVSFLETKFPAAKSDPRRTIFYSLDNEPDLWATTHPRIRGATTGSTAGPLTYAELLQRTKDYASAVKAVAPLALVFGPVSYGWQGFVNLQGAPDAGGKDFLEHYLGQLKAAEATSGQRLVDVLDLHWYPEAKGGGVRITEDSTAAAVAAARIQAPRSLWDPGYTETSWITQASTMGPIQLLPRVQKKIDAHYPGTKIAITEYYYGGGDHISGALAQADVLGIFGREGVFAAALWRLGQTGHAYIWGGFEIYRSYDGTSGAFGDTSIAAATTDVASSSVYAAVDAGQPGRLVLVCLNKTGAPLTAGIAVSHTLLFKKVKVYQLTAAGGSSPQPAPDLAVALKNAFQYTMPAMSVSTLVLLP